MLYKFHRIDHSWPEHNMARYSGPSGEVEAINAFAAWAIVRKQHCQGMKFDGIREGYRSAKVTVDQAKALPPETDLQIWSGKLMFRVYPAKEA